MRFARTLILVSLAVAGCKKDNKDAGGGSAAGSAMAGSGSAMAGSAAGSDMGSAMAGSAAGSGAGSDMAGSGAGSGSDAAAMAHHAGNCPSTVFGSTTKSSVKGKDVVLSITSTDKDAIAAIQKRTDEMLKDKLAAKAPTSAHDQKGTHGGTMGLCPVHLPDGATAKAKHEKDGVTVTITPKDKVDELEREVEVRISRATEWVKNNIKDAPQGNTGGVGGGKGKDGSNHSGQGDGKGQERKKGGGSGAGTGGGGGKGTGGGTGGGSSKGSGAAK